MRKIFLGWRWEVYVYAAVLFGVAVFFIYFSSTAYVGKGIFDFPVFADAAINFVKTGILYDRTSDYSPNLAVYKFPPLFGSLLVVGVKLGVGSSGLMRVAYGLHVVLYFCSILMLSCAANRRIANSKQQTANSKQQTANSKQQTANSKQRTANR